MVKKVKTRRTPAARSTGFNRRDLLLAGLGAASLARKQGIRLYGSMLQEGRSLQAQANGAVADFGQRIGRGIAAARSQVAPLQSKAQALLATVRTEVGSRLQPMLARFGSRTSARRAPRSRQIVARKTTSRRGPARKAA